MDKHWLNLLQVDLKGPSYGYRQTREDKLIEPRPRRRNEPERWEYEAGAAFLGRYNSRLEGVMI